MLRKFERTKTLRRTARATLQPGPGLWEGSRQQLGPTQFCKVLGCATCAARPGSVARRLVQLVTLVPSPPPAHSRCRHRPHLETKPVTARDPSESRPETLSTAPRRRASSGGAAWKSSMARLTFHRSSDRIRWIRGLAQQAQHGTAKRSRAAEAIRRAPHGRRGGASVGFFPLSLRSARCGLALQESALFSRLLPSLPCALRAAQMPLPAARRRRLASSGKRSAKP